jgi:hypothetical protein
MRQLHRRRRSGSSRVVLLMLANERFGELGELTLQARARAPHLAVVVVRHFLHRLPSPPQPNRPE